MSFKRENHFVVLFFPFIQLVGNFESVYQKVNSVSAQNQVIWLVLDSLITLSLLCSYFFSAFLFLFFVLLFNLSLYFFTPPFSAACGAMNAGGRWLGCFSSQRDCAHLVPHPLSLPGGQQGGLKSNWQLAGRELPRAVQGGINWQL